MRRNRAPPALLLVPAKTGRSRLAAECPLAPASPGNYSHETAFRGNYHVAMVRFQQQQRKYSF